MNYSLIIPDDVINGDGIRATLFVSGCSLHCPNCHNLQAQNKNYGHKYTDKTKQQIFDILSQPYINGLTLTGGHPLESYNIKECTNLCKDIKAKFPNKTIWLYTGLLYENIINLEILNYIDVLVDGRYDESLHDMTLLWRGSSNQRVIDIKKSKVIGDISLYCQ